MWADLSLADLEARLHEEMAPGRPLHAANAFLPAINSLSIPLPPGAPADLFTCVEALKHSITKLEASCAESATWPSLTPLEALSHNLSSLNVTSWGPSAVINGNIVRFSALTELEFGADLCSGTIVSFDDPDGCLSSAPPASLFPALARVKLYGQPVLSPVVAAFLPTFHHVTELCLDCSDPPTLGVLRSGLGALSRLRALSLRDHSALSAEHVRGYYMLPFLTSIKKLSLTLSRIAGDVVPDVLVPTAILSRLTALSSLYLLSYSLGLVFEPLEVDIPSLRCLTLSYISADSRPRDVRMLLRRCPNLDSFCSIGKKRLEAYGREEVAALVADDAVWAAEEALFGEDAGEE
jgi:hypothetical protein